MAKCTPGSAARSRSPGTCPPGTRRGSRPRGGSSARRWRGHMTCSWPCSSSRSSSWTSTPRIRRWAASAVESARPMQRTRETSRERHVSGLCVT
eukprot:60820-Prymnesium_polylepis.2